MDAVIWRAVSSEAQAGDDTVSLAHQEDVARQHAARHNLRVVEVITSDDSRSVIRLDKAIANPRLGYSRLVSLVEARAFDVLIFYDASRLGRNRALLTTVQELCYASRVILYDCANPPHTLSADVGDAQRIMDSLQAATAQNEVSRQNKRLQFGRDGRAKRGQFAGSVPYGYRAEGERITADPLTAPVVQRIFAAYLDGHGLPRIAADLNAAGIPAAEGGRWQVGTIAYLLNNVQRYAGWLEHNRQSRNRREHPYIKVRGQWPALITDADAERVQSERAARKAHRRIADTPYLLSGVVWCVQCNRPMRINTTRDSRRPQQALRSYLRCDVRAHAHWALRTSDVLLYVRHEMTRLTAADVDRIIVADTSSERTQAAIDAARRTLTRLARALADADDDRYLHGTLDAERHSRTVSRLRTEIANQEAELARLEAVQQREQEAGGRRARLLEVLENGAAILEDADPTRANAWLRNHLRVWAKDGEVVLVDWSLEWRPV